MTALAVKERGVETYPVSDEARQRIDSAKMRALTFEARRILAEGGFRDQEVEAIVSVILPYLRSGAPIDLETVKKGLVARQFARKEAESIASALAAQ